ncbi:MAG: hypothetical protein U0166_21505 [Acidobacteriota bacterium]
MRVNLFACQTIAWGARVALGDVADGDGSAEIVTAPGPGPMFGPTIKGFHVTPVDVQAVPGLRFRCVPVARLRATPRAATPGRLRVVDARVPAAARQGPRSSLDT